MYPDFSLNNPPTDSILSGKYLNADYLFDRLLAILKYIFRKEILGDFNTILLFLSLFFLTIIFYSFIRLLEIRRKEHHHTEHEIDEYAHHQAEKAKRQAAEQQVSQNPRWVKVLNLLSSVNFGDWKLSVIEADAMLESLLGDLGFKGETIGDKLKAADPEKFRSLPIAWEAHAVRNRIAHEGTNFDLTLHEARRVIALYEQIFRQYGYI